MHTSVAWQYLLGASYLLSISKICIFVFLTFSVMGHSFDAHKKQENFEGQIFIARIAFHTPSYPTKKTAWKMI